MPAAGVTRVNQRDGVTIERNAPAPAMSAAIGGIGLKAFEQCCAIVKTTWRRRNAARCAGFKRERSRNDLSCAGVRR